MAPGSFSCLLLLLVSIVLPKAAVHCLSKRHQRKQGFSSLSSPALSVPEEVRRELAEKSVTDFCSDLRGLENFVTAQFRALFESDEILILSSGKNNNDNDNDGGGLFVCSCVLHEEDDELDVECGAFNALLGSVDYVATIDYMKLKLGDDGTYVPFSSGWCDFLVDGYDGYATTTTPYCEDYILNAEDPTKFESCTVSDGTCDGNTVCQICDGGKTISLLPSTNDCYFGTLFCTDEYTGPFLHTYNAGNPIKVKADEAVECRASSDIPTKEEFCNKLSEIQETISQDLFEVFEDELEVKPYECECVSIEEGADSSSSGAASGSSFGITCASNFPLNDGTPYRNIEMMTFKQENGYFVPNQVQWCDYFNTAIEEEYCETFELTFLREQLSTCVIGDCEAEFCELCADGIRHASTCQANSTCVEHDGYYGSFLISFKDIRVAVNSNVCDTTPSTPGNSSPVAAPTKGPTTLLESSATAVGLQHSVSYLAISTAVAALALQMVLW
eukprot:CAMPEP_0117036256 /NCGR_PEP_ID=MMETSP0472-20121206/25693_1 /TAXON_ID=693140 ORGANISM="Tiarina fusus, Strain LIS" /NCGR_SAMPLE_ID=MMETSP0472 /ASSEMBLY_ACC=CAM_ASM_000603 /LENGTH=501 /DNA_ID=CAMNT_0004745957 /DNA_START=25 /DNA_END=1527 /DNA_ORIENTATION=-